MKYQIVNKENDKIYKEKGKELEFNNYLLAKNKLLILKTNEGEIYSKLVIKEISNNKIRYLNEKNEEIESNWLNKNKDPEIKIKTVVNDDDIEKEWNKINKIYEKSTLPIDDLISKKNDKNEILSNIIYIHKIIYMLENGKELLNEEIFENNKNNLIYFGKKLIDSIDKIDISEEKINLNYNTIKYY